MQELYDWIDNFVTQHNDTFGGVPCPYARKAMRDKTVDIRETKNLKVDLFNLMYWDTGKEAVILHCDKSLYTVEELSSIVDTYNQHAGLFCNLVALEDHPDDPEIVKGVKMNFGKAILVIVQELDKLTEASNKLKAQGYYDDWEEENYNNIVAWRK